MIVAGRNTMYGESSSGKPPWDWSLETAMALRSKFKASLSPVTSMPDVVSSGTISVPSARYNVVPLAMTPGLGVWTSDSSSSSIAKYYVLDPISTTLTYTGTSFDVGSSSNFDVHFCRNIDGKMVVESRYQGKVYVMDEDGSNLTYIGQSDPSHNTNDGHRLFANYDGTVSDVDAGTRTHYVIGRDFSITKVSNLDTQYPHSFIKLPDYYVTLSMNGYVSVWNNGTQTLKNRNVMSYASAADAFKVFPEFPNCVFYGMHIRNNQASGVKIGLNLSTLADITSSQPYMGVDSQGISTILPTGQMFYQRETRTDYESGKTWYGLFDPASDSHIRLNIETKSAPRFHMYTLSNGMVFSHCYSNSVIIYNVFNFGFPSKYYPTNLLTGPFGYNRFYS